MKRVLIFTLLAASPSISSAHHSNAEYDRNAIREIEGELIEVRWRNPHVQFTVRAPGDDGQLHDWELETSTVYVLGRLGLDGSRFPESGTVRAAGWASRTRPAMRVTNMLLPDGREVLISALSRPRWSEGDTSRLYQGKFDRSGVQEAVRVANGIYRVWTTVFGDEASFPLYQADEYPLTEKGQRLKAQWDPRASPDLAI